MQIYGNLTIFWLIFECLSTLLFDHTDIKKKKKNTS